MKKKKKKKKNKFIKTLIPIISLLITFGLLFLLFKDLKALIEGDDSGSRILGLIWKSFVLFISPFILNPKRIENSFSNLSKRRSRREKVKLNLRIKKLVKLNEKYKPCLIVKCPKCKFENPSSTKRCFNCNYELNY